MPALSDYDYYLPKHYIAQFPSEVRHNSKLMVVRKKQQQFEDRCFSELDTLLKSGDLLVFNNAKVIPARLLGNKETGGKVEVFLLKDLSQGKDNLWEVLVKPSIKPGKKILFSEDLSAECLEVLEEGKRLVKFETKGNFYQIIDKIGQVPLPPYIKYEKDKKSFYEDRYQTIYAQKKGAVAAPTAGLHFSEELFVRLANKGIDRAFVTLYVGADTFRPIKVDNYLEHKMHSETYELTAETIEMIEQTKKRGGKVVAVGTTTARVLEGVYHKYSGLKEGAGATDIFIYPGFKFKVIDALITNFHLPKSSLLLMISAFSDKKLMMDAYEHAKAQDYRFFSFGDAMLIV